MNKSKFLLVFMLAALFVGFSACGSDDDDIVVKLEKSEAEVEKDSTITIKITAGNGQYTATTADDKIATATTNDNTVVIKGIALGSTSITVKDKDGKTASVTVNVFDIVGDWTFTEAKIEVAGVAEQDAEEIKDDFNSITSKSLTLKNDGKKFELKVISPEEKEAAAEETEEIETLTGTYSYKDKVLTLTFDIEEGEDEADITILKVTELTKSSLKFESDQMDEYKEDYPALTKAIAYFSLTRKVN